MTEEIKKLKELINGTDNIVFFGGAGVSTESGIPDFRSVDGLYHQQWDDPPETILSHTYYERYPEKFFAFYRAKLLCEGAKPNAAHLKLAEWEREGKLKAIITQNIDGLHQAAGSKNAPYKTYAVLCFRNPAVIFPLRSPAEVSCCRTCRHHFPDVPVQTECPHLPAV